jgi:riboflavin synthase
MFTGLIQDLGSVQSVTPGATTDLWIQTRLPIDDLALGESISIQGACLTVVRTRPDAFLVQAAPETLRRTTISGLKPGDPVHLERAMRMGDRLGGHLVLGHVDGVAQVLAARPDGGAWEMEIALPTDLAAYFIPKGSVTLDGVSLTVNRLESDRFSVSLIPETQQRTALAQRKVAEGVNVEADVIGKYVARLYGLARPKESALSEQALRAAGFGG